MRHQHPQLVVSSCTLWIRRLSSVLERAFRTQIHARGCSAMSDSWRPLYGTTRYTLHQADVEGVTGMSRFRIAAAISGSLLLLLSTDAGGAQGGELLDRLATAESGYSTDLQGPAEGADLRSRIVELRKELTSIAASLPLAQDRVS